MNVRPIRTKRQYATAMRRLRELFDLDVRKGSPEDDEVTLLLLVIEHYERSLHPPVQPDPVEAILFRMDQMGLTRKDLEPFIGPPSRVTEILSRRRGLSLSMIRRLHAGLGIPPAVLIAPSWCVS